MRHAIRSVLLTSLMLAVVVVVGCVASKYTLIPPEQAKVDHNYFGDYESIDANGHHTTILIRNLDNKQYFVEFAPADGDKPTRYVGFTAPLKDAVFAELREIRDDGEVPEAWSLLRIDLADDKLTLRPLSEDFYKSATINSADDLRKWVESNLENHEMYDANAVLVATRMK